MSKNFGLIGAAGYIAPRHMAAIKDTENNLIAAMDPNDSVGIIDSYFPNASFFTEIERFDRHIHKLSKTNNKIDYLSICSPNYLHDSHIRLGLRNYCNVICEKPLIINPKNIIYLKELEEEFGKKVYTVLQLRYHDKILELKEYYKDNKKKINIDLNYITSRGKWYLQSWKGNPSKSGGLAANIGIHFFDMLIWIFGNPLSLNVFEKTNHKISGVLDLEFAKVRWSLSIDSKDLPEHCKQNGQKAYRSLLIDNKEFEFSSGFTDLHTVTYKNILAGNGFGLEDAMASLSIVQDIRSSKTNFNY